MRYLREWNSPLGKIRLASDGEHLTGLWFAGQKYDYRLQPEDVVLPGEPGADWTGGKGIDECADESADMDRNGELDAAQIADNGVEGASYIFERAQEWLERYFSGEKPSPEELPLRPEGTDFRQMVWRELLHIPYGQVTTYGSLAKAVARKMGRETMSAQAVGQAVGHNPISIIIPCHRVVGANGSLTGYAGGLDRKIRLLELEKPENAK